MTVAAHPPSRALLPTVWKLLGLRWRINFNGFRRGKFRTKFFTVFGLVALVVFAGLLFWGSWMLLGFLRSPQLVKYTGVDSAPFLDSIPVAVFTVMFIGILLTSFGVLLQALYLSGDMDFLLVAPVPIRAVFFTKLLQAVLPNFSLMLLFGLPLLYGLGASRNYNFLFYPLVPLVMAALTLSAAGLSSLLVMLVVRIFPAKRVAEVLGFLGATISILCSQSGNFMNLRRGSSVNTTIQLKSLVDLLVRFNNPWFPLNWAGRGLVELGNGNWLPGVLLVVLTLTLFAGAFWFALATAESWYYTGWARMQVVVRKKRSVASASRPEYSQRGTLFARLGRLLPAPTRGIIQKDFITLRRDLRNLSQLVTPLIFGVIYASAFLRNGPPSSAGRDDIFTQSLQSLFVYGNVGVALFVGWQLLTRLGGMAFSQEGKNYWMLKVSPVRVWHLMIAKFVVAYLPALVMGSIFMTIVSVIQRLPIGSYLYSMVVTALCLAGMAGVMVAFGAAGANLTWDDPRKMNAGWMGCFGMIVMVLLTAISFTLFVGPLALVAFLELPEIYGYLGGLLFGGVFSIGSAFFPLALAYKKVEKLGEG
jgi:ABC-2 type transport system permease protein